MIKRTLNEWRAGPRSLVKKLFIGYLALVTGCTTPLQQVEQGAALSNERGQAFNVSTYNSASARNNNSALAEPAAQPGETNRYNLPELGGSPVEPTSDESHSLLDELSGGLADPARQDIANPLVKGFENPDALQGMAVGMLTSAATEGVKNWFSAKNATAEMSVSAGERGAFTGSFDLLMPVYDNKTDLVFAQIGYRRSNALTEDYRNTVNFGVGYRRNIDNWLAGVNAFYDRDLTGQNGRFSIGAEAFTDDFKASANVYVRATDWHKSPDLEDYLERPANGYDLRIDANLPSYPQLGGKLVYEQYFGDQVGLFGSANRQKDPQAVTVGLTYNPVPMIGFGVDYRQGQGVSETSGKLTINYQFGVPLAKQLSLDYSKSHKLENSRFDLVNRRYDVILDYKEKDAGQLMLPAQVSGTPTQTVSFPITVTDHTIGSFTWTGTAAQFALPYGGGPTASVVLPAYQENGNNLYTLQAIGTDRFGRVIQSNLMQVRVDAFLIALDRSAASAKADGNDEVMFTASLQEPTGAAKANTTVMWDVQGAANVIDQDEKTDRQGKARLTLTSRFASAVRVTVQEPQGAKAESDAAFAGDQRTAKVISLTATPSTITADGKSVSKLVATIADANGNPVGAGAPVQWSTTSGEVSSASTLTSEDSTATVELTSAVTIGAAKVTAKAVAGAADTVVTFTADNATARVLSLVATPAAVPADGIATSQLVAVIEDANGNPVGAGIPVAWSTTAGKLASLATVTDAASKATVTLTAPTLAGSGTVTAKASAGAADTVIAFDANTRTAKVVGLTATPETIKANGADSSELVAAVEDAHGNPVAGVSVTWSTSTGTLSSNTSTTDAQGETRVTLKGTAAGVASVKASAVAGAATASVNLVPDGVTAKVVDLTATPATIKANGADSSELVATIEDASGNPVAGAPVTWSTSTGNLSSASSVTDAQGKTRVTLKGTAAGVASVKASAVAGAATASV
ncbi:inverse autotransporter beta domain-containing protein, partial [Pseudomonas mosselii]|uniref:inverse autotransporter beta domain-containing protein n=1 Tax=Pseudomonas mosselii TaxID=78327 RepID=UPI00263529F1